MTVTSGPPASRPTQATSRPAKAELPAAPDRFADRFLVFARACGVAAATLGAVLLLASLLAIDLPFAPASGEAAIDRATAGGLIVLGLALASPRRSLMLGAAVAAALLGAARLLHELLGSAALDVAPHMAWSTALLFCLLGLGLALLARRRPLRVLPVRLLSLAALCLSINALFGHAFSVEALYRFGGPLAMAAPTALAFLIAAVGIEYQLAFHVPGALLSDPSAGGTHVRQLLPAVLVVPLMLGLAAAQGLRSNLWSQAVAAAMLSTVSVFVLGGLVCLTGAHLRAMDRSRLQAARELAEREELFRATFENAFVGIAHIGLDLRVLLANSRFREMVGYRDDHPSTVLGLIAPEDREAFANAIRRLASEEIQEYRAEHRLNHRDGTELFGEVRVKLQKNAQGQPLFCILVIADVTSARETNELLRVYKRAVHAAGYGVVLAHADRPDHPILDVNAAFERLTGYAREEVLGRNCRFLNRNARDQEGLARIRKALSQGEPCTEIILNHRKDGTPIWVRLSLTPVFDENGTLRHFVGLQDDATSDVAHGKRQERILENALVARENAERSNRSRDMLLAVVSHELRSPLNAVRLWASLLSADPTPEQVQRCAQEIEASVESLSRLIGDLLDISRIASGRLHLRRELLELNSLVADCVAAFEPQIAAKSIDLTFTGAKTPIVVNGDRDRLAQVVRNLLDNALKFTPASKSIRVSLRALGEDEVELEVVDSGPGFGDDELPHVFEQFWQADAGNTRERGGLGLGLSIVKHIVERHGGRVAAGSNGSGQGARLSVRLPITGVRAPASATSTSLSGEAAAKPRGGDVLVVDDDMPTAEALALALSARGIATRTANSVDAALAQIQSARPRVVVSDLMMPGRTGLELMDEIRADENRSGASRIHGIAITGRSNPTDRRLVRRAGFDGYLLKPIDIRALLARIAAADEETDNSGIDLDILVVDKRGDLAGALAERLRLEGHRVEVGFSIAVARQLAAQHPPNVLITAMQLEDGTGEDLARELCEDHSDLFVVGISGSPEALQNGDTFDLVLVKPVHFDELVAALPRAKF